MGSFIKGKKLLICDCFTYLASKSHTLTISFTVSYLENTTVRLKLFVILK
jgi:hypothetical protein